MSDPVNAADVLPEGCIVTHAQCFGHSETLQPPSSTASPRRPPMTDRLYKVTGAAGGACNGGSGRWSLPTGDGPGDWMPVIDNIKPCKRGYHLVGLDQLPAWLGPEVWVAEFHPDAEVIDAGDKLVGSQARLVAATGWDERSARLFAADCAEHVLHLFEDRYPNDPRPRAAITAARRFAAGEIDREALAAARAAAWDAARAAAWDAAWAADGDATWAAAGAAAGAAARDAAGDATWAAAWDAAWAAAGGAARAAAWDAERRWQTERLARYLHPKATDG